MIRILIILLFLMISSTSFSKTIELSHYELVYSEVESPNPILKKLFKRASKQHKTNRLTAAGLALVLGPFGGHRLYLGTHHKVPVIYAVTLGGFFVIPIVDMGVILFTKDFDRLKDDDRVIMWTPKHKKSQTE